jgi:hypothetical protein
VSRLSLPRAFLGLAILAVALMIPFDTTITRILGVACIFGALAVGMATIASPEFLAGDAEDESPPRSPAANEDGQPPR